MLIKPALLHFKFDGFANLSSEAGSYVESDVLTDSNGNKWQLLVYPGGINEYFNKQGWVGLYLRSHNKESLDTAYSMTIKDENGAVYASENDYFKFQPAGVRHDTWGEPRYIMRATILDPNNNILVDGALCIDLTIQVKPELRDFYIYDYGIANKMKNLLESGERSDATIKVGDETFKVHSCIIHNNAPILANLLNQIDQNLDTVVEDIFPDVFRLILEFVYTGCCPDNDEVLEFGKELIDAANKFELVKLKVDVENVLVCKRVMTIENVSDWILFAEHNLVLC